MPPPLAAEFPLTVMLPMVSGPPLNMPPPRPAVLPLTVHLVIVKVSSFATARAWRIEPGPLSLVLVTTITVACAESASAQANVRQNATPWILVTLLMTIKSGRIVNATNVTVLSLARKRRSIRTVDGLELVTIALHR